MEDRHRNIIQKNFVQLVEDTALDDVLFYLIQEGVFSAEMAQKYRNPGVNVNKRKHELYLDIPRRGPNAWNGHLRSLFRAGHFELAHILDPVANAEQFLQSRITDGQPINKQGVGPSHLGLRGGQSGASNSGIHPFNLPNYQVLSGQDPTELLEQTRQQAPNSYINLGTVPTEVVVVPAATRMDLIPNPKIKTYRMGSRPKGFALIINNIQFKSEHDYRAGAEVDSRNLKILLEGLGYEVTLLTDLGYNDMIVNIRKFRDRKEHSQVDSCVVALLSHGQRVGGTDEVISQDGRGLPYEDVLEMFNHVNCPLLFNKPKFFVFQTCRGTDRNYFIEKTNSTDSAQISRFSRTVSDTIVACSTLPGYVANRDRFRGTWFIDTLCRVFMNNAHNTHVSDLLTMVDEELSGIQCEKGTGQTSCFENRGLGHLYFNPGLYDIPSEP